MNLCVFYPHEWGKALDPGDERSIHIRNILALRKNDSIRIGLVNGGRGEARLLGEPSGDTMLELEFPPVETLVPDAPGGLHLIIGHPRPPVFQRLLRDLCAIGVEGLHWIKAEKSEKSYLASRAWEAPALMRQLRLGMEQGMRTSPPELFKHYSLPACLSAAEFGRTTDPLPGLLLHPAEPGENCQSMFDFLASRAGGSLAAGSGGRQGKNPPTRGDEQRKSRLLLAIGPEGGWTATERGLLSERGFTMVHLGNSILRTENACVAAASLAVQFLSGTAPAHPATAKDIPGSGEAEK